MGPEQQIQEAMTPRGDPPSRTAVVGYDGSELSRAALSLAARRAGPRGRLLVAYAAPMAAEAALGLPAPPPPESSPYELGERLLSDIDATWTGGLAVTKEVRIGTASRVLADLAREIGADEIVVGSHGAGRLRALLGSTSHGLVHDADRPVVVLTTRAADCLAGPGEPAHLIVLGYDGSDDAKAALAYARRHLAPDGRILAVHACGGRKGERGARLLEEIEAPPQVLCELVEDQPAAALGRLAAERGADEIVVGSRGHGAVRAALGSVAHAVLHEADRPVVIVR